MIKIGKLLGTDRGEENSSNFVSFEHIGFVNMGIQHFENIENICTNLFEKAHWKYKWKIKNAYTGNTKPNRK